jgi:hypothetical protein
MDVETEVLNILHESKELISSEDFSIALDFFSRHELHLVIEFLCDIFVENDVYIPFELGVKIQNIVEKMALYPERTWESLIVSKNEGKENFRLVVGKDDSELFEEVNEIYQALRGHLDLEGDGSASDFLIHGEYALAMEVICSELISKKFPITREFAKKVKTALIDTKCEDDSISGLMIMNN